jgi:hypothetical protein
MSEERIAELLARRWWDLPDSEVRRLIPVLMSDRIADLPGTDAV